MVYTDEDDQTMRLRWGGGGGGLNCCRDDLTDV